jgi:hypothetical protein
MKKEYLNIVELIEKDLIDSINRKTTANMEVVDLVIRNKKVKISKIKQKKFAVITFEKNNIGGVLFSYGQLYNDEFGGSSIRLFQKGILKDREVGFLKLKRGQPKEQ